MLIQLVWVSDAGHIEGLADESPESRAIGLGNDVGRDTVSTSVPAGEDLTTNETAAANDLRDENECTLLEFHAPLITFSGPDVTLVAVLVLVLLCLGVCGFERLQVVDELDFLVEDLLLRIVATE